LRGLISALRSETMDEPLCLVRSSTEGVPFEQLTTMRLEVLGALRSLGTDAREALPVVAAETKSVARAGTFHDRIRQEAIKTLGEIEASIRKDASMAEARCAACAADSAPLVSSPWLAAGERENVLSSSARFTVQDGRELTWGDLTGQPTVVTFFYTHCVNPKRCDRTMALVGSLRKRLERDQNLVRSVRILCVTMEPTRDDPPALRGYARDHQMPVDDNLMFVRPALTSPATLVDGLKFPVNLSGDRVNSHAVALYVLDKNGRVARTYRSLLWDPADVARDLDRLRSESETQR
jgi:cytochrome oxidase Cu insertion factor (SCO1/SenC/PrrC family)